jgi:hypothetical protein
VVSQESPQLRQLVYISAAARLWTDEELAALLEQSRRRNEAEEVTGMLVYSDGSFMQVLEGTPESLSRVCDSVFDDQRHRGLITLIDQPIRERSFGGWSMGFARATRQDLLGLPGGNDFFAGGKCLSDIGSGEAKTLLAHFRRTNP